MLRNKKILECSNRLKETLLVKCGFLLCRLKNIILFLGILLIIASCKEREETVQELVDKGVDLVNETKYEEAIVLYSKAIRLNSKVQLAYYNRGIAHTEIKEYSKALSDFNKIIQLKTSVVHHLDNNFNPTDEGIGQVEYDDAMYQRAIVKSYMDSLQSAFTDFQVLVEKNYKSKSNCLIWQGILLGRSGSSEKACDYFLKAKESATSEPERQEAVRMINEYCKVSKTHR